MAKNLLKIFLFLYHLWQNQTSNGKSKAGNAAND
jgi:hypothetical protein